MISKAVIFLSLALLNGCVSANTKPGDRCFLQNQKLVDGDFWVEVAHYGSHAKKTMLIMPPTGGENLLDRKYARMFCEAGYEVYILKEWTNKHEQDDDLELHQRLYERSQKAISLVLKEVKDTSQIGMLGTSVGALFSAVAASFQPRLNAVFVIVGGAPIASIIVNSDQQAMVDLAERRKQRYGFTTKEHYQSALAAKFKLEPMNLGPGFKNKKLGALIALEDTTVPTAAQKELVSYWQPQTVIERNNGHFWAIANAWLFDSDSIFKFFEASLN